MIYDSVYDFIKISVKSDSRYSKSDNKKIIIEPVFIVTSHKDLLIKGGNFYAAYDSDTNLWDRDPEHIVKRVDKTIRNIRSKYPEEASVICYTMGEYRTNSSWDLFKRYCHSLGDTDADLDTKIAFKSEKLNRDDYCSKRLNYDLDYNGSIDSYNELVSVLYSPDERRKFEWGIGCVLSGENEKIEKFFTFYGSHGTGKSTILKIIEMLFQGYVSHVDVEAVVKGSAFALAPFSRGGLVYIEHDTDLSRISTNHIFNSIVSHDSMTFNLKYRQEYTDSCRGLLFVGTNEPIQITGSTSGLNRRIIDINPTGDLVEHKRYLYLMNQIKFELGAIAAHCIEVYRDANGRYGYDNYKPSAMKLATNSIYNFVNDNYRLFKSQDGTYGKQAWRLWNVYKEENGIKYDISYMRFREDLKEYFKEYKDRFQGKQEVFGKERPSQVYFGFKSDMFKYQSDDDEEEDVRTRLELNSTTSKLDKLLKYQKAQYATEDGRPKQKWDNVKTTLQDLDTSKTHYVLVPHNHIVIDLDIKNRKGEKDLDMNLIEAAKFPPTYAELSQSGNAVHLHYIYDGDPDKLSSIYEDDIEIKVYSAKQGVRRKLTKCNDLDVSHISSGLPLKEEKKEMLDFKQFANEKAIRTFIKRNLNKEIHPGTKPSIDFIFKGLEDAYHSGMPYDVSDLKSRVTSFAASSTHHADYCLEKVAEMHFSSENDMDGIPDSKDTPLAFFDVEVFPNYFLLCYMNDSSRPDYSAVVSWENPDIEKLKVLMYTHRLIGFNNRKYDNHIIYGWLEGMDNLELYHLSKRIIDGDPTAFFKGAYDLSYADVYDFINGENKMGLKKWEIKLGMNHIENEYDWDKPLEEYQQDEIVKYCQNDVRATRQVFRYCHDDFVAREILAKISGGKVNDTTNSLTARLIFGNNRHPQSVFNYVHLDEMFPGYKFENGKSFYRGEEVGEGGYVYAEPGYYEDVALLDIASMHPSSIIAMNLFGDTYTQKFKDLVDMRLAIKHLDFEKAKAMFGGTLSEYLNDTKDAKALAGALKIAINSVYGLTASKFDTPFRDPRNVDNIVAKRGALFMIDLKYICKEKGMKVIHIKTDSIKIANATEDDVEFIMEYGKPFGYNFEHEATYSRICLLNDAVYAAKYKDSDEWTTTGYPLVDPYIFKTLFGDPDSITFDDLIQVKSVTKNASIRMYDPENPIDEGIFIGKVGAFVPVKKDGYDLKSVRDGRIVTVTGTKGYRWTDASLIKDREDRMDLIDWDYFHDQRDKVVKNIEKFVKYEDLVGREV